MCIATNQHVLILPKLAHDEVYTGTLETLRIVNERKVITLLFEAPNDIHGAIGASAICNYKLYIAVGKIDVKLIQDSLYMSSFVQRRNSNQNTSNHLNSHPAWFLRWCSEGLRIDIFDRPTPRYMPLIIIAYSLNNRPKTRT